MNKTPAARESERRPTENRAPEDPVLVVPNQSREAILRRREIREMLYDAKALTIKTKQR